MSEELVEMNYASVARVWAAVETLLGVDHCYLACRAALEHVDDLTDHERDEIAALAVPILHALEVHA